MSLFLIVLCFYTRLGNNLITSGDNKITFVKHLKELCEIQNFSLTEVTTF